MVVRSFARLGGPDEVLGDEEVVQVFTLRKDEETWLACRTDGEPDMQPVTDAGLLAAFDRVERRVNRFQLFRPAGRPWGGG